MALERLVVVKGKSEREAQKAREEELIKGATPLA